MAKEAGNVYKSPAALDTIEDIMAVADSTGLKPCIIAESYSSGMRDANGETIYKYHVYFASDKPVTDVTVARKIIMNLQKLFSANEKVADPACKDPARLIFGTSSDKKVVFDEVFNTIEALLNCCIDSDDIRSKDPNDESDDEELKCFSDDMVDVQSDSSLCSEGEHDTNMRFKRVTDSYKDYERNMTSYLKLDPDILLLMLDTNDLPYDEFISATAAHKASGGSDEIYFQWADEFISDTHTHEEVLAQNRATRKSLHGKNHTIGTLVALCKKYALEAYEEYVDELACLMKDKHSSNSASKAEQAEAWKPIIPFDAPSGSKAFPMETLPEILREYVTHVAIQISVYPEMCVLPLLSVLSLCVQGKVSVKHPGTGHIEPLNLYTLTVADPGERKTSALNAFIKPIVVFEKEFNMLHKDEIVIYNSRREALNKKLKNASAKGKTEDISKIRNEFLTLERNAIKRKQFIFSDTTPEALAYVLSANGERAAIMSDEPAFLKILCGLYSKSGVNLDVYLQSYDGTTTRINRKNSEDILLYTPLLTIGAMTQPSVFETIRKNSDITGQGLLQRFCFAFPGTMTGTVPFETPSIPINVYENYCSLIHRLINMTAQSNPICFSNEGRQVVSDYHDHMQKEMQRGGMFEYIRECGNKQVAKVLRIAALLHLCEHSADCLIDKATSEKAVMIGEWLEYQSLKAFELDLVSGVEKNARELAQKLKTLDVNKVYSQRDILRRFRKLDVTELKKALIYLDDMHFLKYEEDKVSRGRPRMLITFNPDIKDFEI